MMQIKEILFWRQSVANMINIQPIHNSFTCMPQSRRFATGSLLVLTKVRILPASLIPRWDLIGSRKR